uniref:tetratricopeptide repeat protein n=1 Tax=Amphritea sp. TaxID=1872502 RepID=UPI003D115BC3
ATFIELSILNLKQLLLDTETSPTVLSDSIRKVQKELTENKQKFPSNGHVYKLEVAFSQLINDHSNALKALERSFEENDREPYLAIRLSSIYIEAKKLDKAREILTKAIERRRTDHNLNFHFAEFLRNYTDAEQEEITYYYRRAFTPNDRHYQAQFWFARFSYFSNNDKQHQEAMDIFNHIRGGRFSFKERHKIRDYDGGMHSPRSHSGRIVRKREGFGFVIIDGTGYELFIPEKQVEEGLWGAMKENDRINFNIAFSFSGPFAASIKPT